MSIMTGDIQYFNILYVGEDEVFSFDLIKTDLLLSDVTEVLVCRLYTTTIIFYWIHHHSVMCVFHTTVSKHWFNMSWRYQKRVNPMREVVNLCLFYGPLVLWQPVFYVFICMMAHYICMNDGNRDCNYILYVVPLKMLYVHFLELSL